MFQQYLSLVWRLSQPGQWGACISGRDAWLLIRMHCEIKCNAGILARQRALSSSSIFSSFFSYLIKLEEISYKKVLSQLVFYKGYSYNISHVLVETFIRTWLYLRKIRLNRWLYSKNILIELLFIVSTGKRHLWQVLHIYNYFGIFEKPQIYHSTNMRA